MTSITDVKARKIINSRGEPTIEVEIDAEENKGIFSSPSGASVGKHEAKSFPEKGVDEAIEILRNKKEKIKGLDVSEQEKIDKTLRRIDGTNNFSYLGGNTSIAVSIASAKAAAKSSNKQLYEYISRLIDLEPSLPLPLGNMIEGGEHASKGATEIQEFLALPTNVKTIKEAILANAEVHKITKKILESKKPSFQGGKGDEGGWVESLSTQEALDILKESIKYVEDQIDTEIDIKIGLDVAASELWNGKKYEYRRSENKSTKEQINFMKKLSNEYGIKYIEDPLHEDDYDGFKEIKEKIGKNTLICGDDLFVTNKKRIKKGIKKESANTILIKPNQIGTLTETLEAIKLAKKNKYKTVVSHRSGETTDDSITHLAVSTSEIIKCGAVNGERTSKLNELIRIEEKTKLKPSNLRC